MEGVKREDGDTVFPDETDMFLIQTVKNAISKKQNLIWTLSFKDKNYRGGLVKPKKQKQKQKNPKHLTFLFFKVTCEIKSLMTIKYVASYII